MRDAGASPHSMSLLEVLPTQCSLTGISDISREHPTVSDDPRGNDILAAPPCSRDDSPTHDDLPFPEEPRCESETAAQSARQYIAQDELRLSQEEVEDILQPPTAEEHEATAASGSLLDTFRNQIVKGSTVSAVLCFVHRRSLLDRRISHQYLTSYPQQRPTRHHSSAWSTPSKVSSEQSATNAVLSIFTFSHTCTDISVRLVPESDTYRSFQL